MKLAEGKKWELSNNFSVSFSYTQTNKERQHAKKKLPNFSVSFRVNFFYWHFCGFSFETLKTHLKVQAFDHAVSIACSSGIQEVIFNRRIWTSEGGERVYSGVNPHTDHVHIGLNRCGARSFNHS